MKLKKSPKKLRSKRGLTLVEILIGVTIVVVVFASTLGAMVGGFTTTVYNADENRAAILNASLNEIILNTVHNMRFTERSEVDDAADDIRTDDTTVSVLLAAVSANIPDAVYVDPEPDASGNMTVNFPSGVSYQYTLIPDVQTKLNKNTATDPLVDMNGVTIKTCFESAGGPIVYESFVPYTK